MPNLVVEASTDQGVAARLRMRVGDRSITFRGIARLVELAPEQLRAVLEIEAVHGRSDGAVEGRIELRLLPAGGGTRVVLEPELVLSGRAPTIPAERLAEAGGRLIPRWFDQLAGSAPEPRAETVALTVVPDATADAPAPAPAEQIPPTPVPVPAPVPLPAAAQPPAAPPAPEHGPDPDPDHRGRRRARARPARPRCGWCPTPSRTTRATRAPSRTCGAAAAADFPGRCGSSRPAHSACSDWVPWCCAECCAGAEPRPRPDAAAPDVTPDRAERIAAAYCGLAFFSLTSESCHRIEWLSAESPSNGRFFSLR